MDNNPTKYNMEMNFFSYKRKFQYLSALILLCAVTLVGVGFKYFLTEQIYSDASMHNAQLARWLSNNNDPNKTLARIAGQGYRLPSMVKLRAYDLNGNTIYSTNPSEVGTLKAEPYALVKASKGIEASSVEEYKTTPRNIQVVVSWLPVFANDKTTIVGVVEIYRNIDDALQSVASEFVWIFLVLCLVAIVSHVIYTSYIARLYTATKSYERQSISNKEHNEYLEAHDSLTGLLNRGMFVDRLSHAAKKSDRMNGNMAIVYVDIDRFKLINESLGYVAGDEIVKMAAERIKTDVRESDTIARVGGDEFIVLLETVTDPQEAVQVVTRIQEGFSDSFMYCEREVSLTASIGIAMYPEDEDNLEELMSHAATAKDKAKQNGGNEFRFYTRDMNVSSWNRLEMEGDLRRALEKDQYILHFQPKVDLLQGRITGMESLLRWQRDDVLVRPDEFIPLLEQTGLIVPVGEWVLRESCKAARKWMEEGSPPLVVAVNVSARQFRQLDFLDIVKRILIETRLAPELLEIEVTEGILMEDTVASAATIEALKQHGVRVAIDDFGTGYSSLSYLQRYRVDTLKIDKAFVQDIENNSEGAAIATTIISLAHNLRLHIVAEGVETHDQLAFLMALGCQQIQGYLFSKPLPAQEFTELLKNDANMFRNVLKQQKNIA